MSIVLRIRLAARAFRWWLMPPAPRVHLVPVPPECVWCGRPSRTLTCPGCDALSEWVPPSDGYQLGATRTWQGTSLYHVTLEQARTVLPGWVIEALGGHNSVDSCIASIFAQPTRAAVAA